MNSERQTRYQGKYWSANFQSDSLIWQKKKKSYYFLDGNLILFAKS